MHAAESESAKVGSLFQAVHKSAGVGGKRANEPEKERGRTEALRWLLQLA